MGSDACQGDGNSREQKDLDFKERKKKKINNLISLMPQILTEKFAVMKRRKQNTDD